MSLCYTYCRYLRSDTAMQLVRFNPCTSIKSTTATSARLIPVSASKRNGIPLKYQVRILEAEKERERERAERERAERETERERAEREKEKLKREIEDVTRDFLWAQGQLNMRGLFAYAESKLVAKLSPEELQGAGSTRRGRWRAILAADNGVLESIKKAGPQWEDVDTAADGMRDLYQLMSSYIHKYDANPSASLVIINRRLLSIGQDVVLACLAEQFSIPYKVVDISGNSSDENSDEEGN